MPARIHKKEISRWISTLHVRQPGDKWLRSEVKSLEETFRLESLDCTVALSEVYCQVHFPLPEGLAYACLYC